MGRTISSESRSGEKAFVISAEYDDQVLEIWDQLEVVEVIKTTKTGVRRRYSYTPDFLLLRKSGPCVVEVKMEKEILQKIEKNPQDWIKNDDGTYQHLPAMDAFDELGLQFRVYAVPCSPGFKVLNLENLIRNRSYQDYAILEEDLERAFGKSFCWSAHALRESLGLACYSPIFEAIDSKRLFFDWDHQLLSEPKGCYLVRRVEHLGFVENFKGPRIYQYGDVGNVCTTSCPTEKQAASAISKINRIKSGEKSRSVRRWKSVIRNGGKEGLTAFESLIPSWPNSGNRKSRLVPSRKLCLQKFLHEDSTIYNDDGRHKSKYRLYIDYRTYAKKFDGESRPVSRKTFVRAIEKMEPEKLAQLVGGRKAANASAPPSDPLDRQLKADIAWQRVAIDHSLAKIYLVYFDGEYPYVMRPWVTAMLDLATSSVLAFCVSFKAPSRVSVARVMRECVRKHGKLPREIIVDRGPDFRSVYFSALLAHSEVELILRPASHSRYGSEVERLFGELKTQWLSQRSGNSTNYKNARAYDGEFKPEKSAVMSAYDFHCEFERFIQWRSFNPRGPISESPAKALARHEQEFPFMPIPQDLDEEYKVASSVDQGRYKVDYRRGLHIDPMWYYSSELRQFKGQKKRLECRKDPDNPHLIYALVGDKWIPCGTSLINRYASLDPVSQRVESLLVTESFNDKKLIKQQADEELVGILREMTDTSVERRGMILKVSADGSESLESGESSSAFDVLKNAEISQLATEDWEVKHVWDH
jgi:putative transposase